jgi:hypothetical protein
LAFALSPASEDLARIVDQWVVLERARGDSDAAYNYWVLGRGSIEVEQPVTQLPPHRSRRAELPHRALQNCSLCTRHFLDS